MTACERIREARRAKSTVARALDADISIEDHGSIVLVRPLVDEAQAWLVEHTDGPWLGNALGVEPRYLHGLVEGLLDAGFDVTQ